MGDRSRYENLVTRNAGHSRRVGDDFQVLRRERSDLLPVFVLSILHDRNGIERGDVIPPQSTATFCAGALRSRAVGGG